MNCKISKLNDNEIILFILGDPRRESIQAGIFMDSSRTYLYLNPHLKEQEIQNRIKNKKIISFNGSSYDLPLLKKNIGLKDFNHLDLYYFFKENIYTEFDRYTIEKILKAANHEISLSGLKILNEYYKKNTNSLKLSLEKHIDARYQLYKFRQEVIEKHSFPFKLFDETYNICLHNVKCKKDFLYLELLSNHSLPNIEYYIDGAEIIKTANDSILVRVPLYTGRIDKNSMGKAIRTDFTEICDDTLAENFYLVEKENEILLSPLEQWLKYLFKNIS